MSQLNLLTPVANLHRGARNGISLVELLIVVAIASILAAVTLPSLKTVMKDRKVNAAAIQLRSMLEAAKSKAMAKGRNVAVVIDRLDDTDFLSLDADLLYTRRNTASRVGLAEVVGPYRGDFESTTANLSSQTMASIVTADQTNESLVKRFAVVGNLIGFGDYSALFEIVGVDKAPDSPIIGNDTYTLTFANQPKITPPITQITSTSLPHRNHVELPIGAVSFRIYSTPKRLFNKPIEFPKGTCIDLSLSGMDNGVTNGSQGFASNNCFTGNVNDITSDNHFKPIAIVFSPNGSVAEIFQNTGTGTDPVRVLPTGIIYLYIGRTDQVVQPTVTRQNAIDNDIKRNIDDLTGYWLRIVPQTGQISIAPNVEAASVADARTLALYGIDQSAK